MLRKLIKTIIPGKTEALLCAIVIIAMVVFASRSISRYDRLNSYYFDLGIMHQVVANTAQGHFLEITDPNYYFQGNRLGYHFDFILAFFAPFYLIFNDARVLLLGQSIIIALGAIPLFLLGKEHLKSKRLGLLVAIAYLLYYPVHGTIIADFHSVTLATTFILWAWYGMEKKQYHLATAMVLLAWCTKENVPLVTAGMGLYFYLKGDKKYGGALLVTSGLWFLTVYKVIMPHFRSGAHFAESYYTSDIITNVHRLLSKESFEYMFAILYPLLFVPLLAPQFLLLIIPEWMIILLSSNTNLRELQYHYTALLTPFIFLAFIYALQKIKNKRFLIALFCVVIFMQWTTLFTRSTLLKHYPPDPEGLRVVMDWKEKLKDPSIPVSTSGHLAPHFSGRRYFYNFFYDFGFWNQGITEEKIGELASHYEKADYVLIKKSEVDPTDERALRYYFHLKRNPNFTMIFEEAGIEVYKKVIMKEI